MTTFYRRHGKRILDLTLTIPTLILLAPVMGIVAFAIWVTMGRPVLFRQASAVPCFDVGVTSGHTAHV